MLGNSPKFKYQSQNFKDKLAKAKTYKRNSSPLAENKFVKFLQKKGLTTWQVKLSFLILLASFIYLLFIPNFLQILFVEISGPDQEQTVLIENKIQSFLNKGIVFKQKNLLLLSKNNLVSFLEQQDEIIKVESLSKIFPNKIKLSIQPRKATYTFNCENTSSDYSNDGKYLKPTEQLASTTAHLIKLVVKPPCPNTDYRIPPAYLTILENLPEQILEALKLKVSSFEFSTKTDPDIKVILENNVFILLDTNSYETVIGQNLKTLYQNLSDEEKKRLFYVDLRIKNKAFVCFKGNACTEQTTIKPVSPEVTASSTTNSIINP